MLTLRVSDAGVGFDPDARIPGHYGLATMRGRALALGGDFRLSSEPGRGTAVEVEL